MTVRCPSCGEAVGGPAAEGGVKVRTRVVIVDPEAGTVTAPCPHCKAPMPLLTGGRADGPLASPGVPATRQRGRRVLLPGVPRREG